MVHRHIPCLVDLNDPSNNHCINWLGNLKSVRWFGEKKLIPFRPQNKNYGPTHLLWWNGFTISDMWPWSMTLNSASVDLQLRYARWTEHYKAEYLFSVSIMQWNSNSLQIIWKQIHLKTVWFILPSFIPIDLNGIMVLDFNVRVPSFPLTLLHSLVIECNYTWKTRFGGFPPFLLICKTKQQ